MKGLKKLFVFIRPFTRPLLIALALTASLTVIGMLPPLLMRRLINDVAKEGKWGIFPLVMGLLFAVPLLRAIINIATATSLNKVGLGIIATTRKRMFEHLLRLTMKFYNQMPVGAVNQRLMGDIATVSTVATGGLITLITDVIAVGFAVVVMLRLSGPLSLLTFALLPFYFLNYRFFSKRMQQTNVILRSQMDHISSMLQERLSAHELIQSYGQEKTESTLFSSQAKQIMDAAVKGSVYSISFNQLAAFLNRIGNTMIYCAGCYYFVKGSMGYGDVVAFCAYATQILGPVVRFSTVANQVVQVGVSVDRINEVLDREPAIKDSPDGKPIDTLRGDIKVERVTFKYEGEDPALDDVALEVPAGVDLAVVGPPGAGRSTLAMLLRRFYEPEEGRIEVDGVDIRDYRLSDYRKSLALVLPESAIFDGTIGENLCYGRPDAPEERMLAVSKAVGLHDLVEGLSQGYDTKLGTGGLKLSTGAQQRIGIARALISDPLILIVDEATANLDPESAHRVNEAIREQMSDRTYVMVVHRALMARDADQIVVMDDGKVTEKGSYQELIGQHDSLYREIFAKQYGEERLPPVREG